MLKNFIEDFRAFLTEMNTIPVSIDQCAALVPNNAFLYWKFTADFSYSYVNMCIE